MLVSLRDQLLFPAKRKGGGENTNIVCKATLTHMLSKALIDGLVRRYHCEVR